MPDSTSGPGTTRVIARICRRKCMTHPVRENFEMAIALAPRGETRVTAGRSGILWKLLPLQEKSPTKATYGVWPGFMRSHSKGWRLRIGTGRIFPECESDRFSVIIQGNCRRTWVEELRLALDRAAYSIFPEECSA